MTTKRIIPPDQLTGDALVARTKGDALHLVELVHDHGTDALHHVMDAWGVEHCRRVTIALAAAVDDNTPARDLWAWLGDPPVRTSRTVPETDLWRAIRPPKDPDDDKTTREISEETRERMRERGRALGGSRAKKAAAMRAAS